VTTVIPALPVTPSLVADTDPAPADVPVPVVVAALEPEPGETESCAPDHETERPVSSDPSAAYVRAVNVDVCPMPIVPAPLLVTTTEATGFGFTVMFKYPLSNVVGYSPYVAVSHVLCVPTLLPVNETVTVAAAPGVSHTEFVDGEQDTTFEPQASVRFAVAASCPEFVTVNP